METSNKIFFFFNFENDKIETRKREIDIEIGRRIIDIDRVKCKDREGGRKRETLKKEEPGKNGSNSFTHLQRKTD